MAAWTNASVPKIRKVKFIRPTRQELTPEEFEEWQAKLKPCPFCGEPARLFKNIVQYFARCDTNDCPASVINAVSDPSVTIDIEVARWNTRTHSVEFQEYDKYNEDPLGTVSLPELDILINHWYDFIDEYKLFGSWAIYNVEHINDIDAKYITSLWQTVGRLSDLNKRREEIKT